MRVFETGEDIHVRITQMSEVEFLKSIEVFIGNIFLI